METEKRNEVFNDFVKFFTCTEEDIKRELTEDQLKEICLQVDCKVNMNLFNPMDDFYRRLQRKGRLTCKTPSQITQALVKCVNHYKDSHYTEEQIREWRIEEWRETKKMNLLLLELWEYERQKAANFPNLPSDSQSTVTSKEKLVKNDFLDVNTESMFLNSEDVPQQVEPDNNIHCSRLHVNIESMLLNPEDLPQQVEPDNNIHCSRLHVNIESMLLNPEDLPPQDDHEFSAVIDDNNVQSTEEIVFTQGSEYYHFHTSVPCTSTQEMNRTN